MWMRKLPNKLVEANNFNGHLTRSVLEWQPFEQFVAFYRRVKSIAYCMTPVSLPEFHTGAHFGATDGILITEPRPRSVVEAFHQEVTKFRLDDLTRSTDHDSGVAAMNTIGINGASASAGDLHMRFQVTVGAQQVPCNEVIHCKLLQTNQKINEDAYFKERERAITGNSDVFLLVTPAQATAFTLPPRCGIVSESEFGRYFGLVASRAYRSFLEPPNINAASYHELHRTEHVGKRTATRIITERQKRRFSDMEDAVNRLLSTKKCKTAEILRCMHCDAQ